MLQVIKGTAFSLQQSDMRGLAPGTAVLAGSVAYVNSSGVVTLGGTGSAGVRGLTINNSTDGDVLESGKIALYSFDGNSIVATDQVDLTTDSTSAINATNYPVGTPIYASTTAGLVAKTTTTNGPIIGWVTEVRQSPQYGAQQASAANTAQNYTSATESAAYAANPVGLPYTSSTKAGSFKPQVFVSMLAIKLAATI